MPQTSLVPLHVKLFGLHISTILQHIQATPLLIMIIPLHPKMDSQRIQIVSLRKQAYSQCMRINCLNSYNITATKNSRVSDLALTYMRGWGKYDHGSKIAPSNLVRMSLPQFNSSKRVLRKLHNTNIYSIKIVNGEQCLFLNSIARNHKFYRRENGSEKIF